MTFTLEDVLNAAREVVAEKGADYIYPNSIGGGGNGVCVYASDWGSPSCIVGHVIHRLDPAAFKQLAEAESEYGPDGASNLLGEGYIPREFWGEDAADAMQIAQEAQDGGETWGEALKAAEG